MSTNIRLKSLSLKEWRQFDNVEIDFHPKLTILTGPNGSGKSTILAVVAHSLTDDTATRFLATPVHDEKTQQSSFSLGTLFDKYNPFKRKPEEPIPPHHQIGKLSYTDNIVADITIPNHNSLQYDVQVSSSRHIPGFRIGSHTALPTYQKVAYLPVSGILPKDAFKYYRRVQHGFDQGQTYQRSERQQVTNPVAPLKETLISFAAFGSGNPNMRATPELAGLFESFQNKLTSTLPAEIGFQRLEVRGSEIVIISSTGEFPVDGASGGLMALIQATWQIFLFTQVHQGAFVVLFDEPENHLHPSLQRDFLGKLSDTFSNVQFVVATHSPFIVASVRESSIYALNFQPISNPISEEMANAVVATQVDLQEKGGSASEILDSVLGVSVTIPIWAEAELTQIIADFAENDLTDASIQKLKERLEHAGLRKYFPTAIARLPR